MQRELLPFAMPHIKINTSDHVMRTRRKICDFHFHSELEFLYIMEGNLCCHTDEKDYYINKGEVIFINSLTPHYTENIGENTRCIMVQFENPSHITGPLKYLTRYLLKTDLPCYIFKNSDEHCSFMREKIFGISSEYHEKNPSYEHFMVAYMYDIIAVLYREKFLSNDAELFAKINIKSILPIIELIDEQYDKDFSLREISHILHLNESYICRLFKKATGGTVMDYLNFVRVCKAEKLLKSGLSVGEVSSCTGFSSQSYFNKVFKKYNLCSPSEYRNLCDFTKHHLME